MRETETKKKLRTSFCRMLQTHRTTSIILRFSSPLPNFFGRGSHTPFSWLPFPDIPYTNSRICHIHKWIFSFAPAHSFALFGMAIVRTVLCPLVNSKDGNFGAHRIFSSHAIHQIYVIVLRVCMCYCCCCFCEMAENLFSVEMPHRFTVLPIVHTHYTSMLYLCMCVGYSPLNTN